MTDVLLNEIIKGHIQSENVQKWLSEKNYDFADKYDYKVSRQDFVNYFISYIHDLANCPNHCPEHPTTSSPLKLNSTLDSSINNCSFNTSTDFKTSTPRAVLKSEIFSPISPLHTKNTDQNRSRDPPLCLGDFLVSSAKKTPKRKKLFKSFEEPTRRIKPTVVTKGVGFQTSNSFDFSQHGDEVDSGLLSEQRIKLVEERSRVFAKNDSSLSLKPKMIIASDKKPLLCLVTHKDSLDKIIELYHNILYLKLVPCIPSQIRFLVSLFLTNCIDCPHNDIFESGHNKVYFAIKALEKLPIEETTIVKLLGANERIEEFSSGLANKLRHQETKPNISSDLNSSLDNNIVNYNVETDNKANFPDAASFQAFKKQRDNFYDILKIWEDQRWSPNWNFTKKLGERVRELFSFPGIVNYAHFARLFKCQLVNSCAQGLKEKGISETNLGFLPSLPINQDKLNMLTNRLTTKTTTSPEFSGYQEFFRDFILHADAIFNSHLSDCLICSIVELNDCQFEDDDQQCQAKLFSCVKNLRILAKFLGFMDGLPYQIDNLPLRIQEGLVKVRKNYHPKVDVCNLLDKACKNHRIIITIPWISAYLCMLDPVSLKLPYFVALLNLLRDVYKNFQSVEKLNEIFVESCLGWLFELPHFPKVDLLHFNQLKQGHKTKDSLDLKKLISHTLISLCCPHFDEIRKILSNHTPANKVMVKYITPVTALNCDKQISKKIEQQLAENFLKSQSAQIRQILEYTSERMTSRLINHINYEIVPARKQQSIDELHQKLAETPSDQDIKKLAAEVAQKHYECLLELIAGEVLSTSEKIVLILDNMLPVHLLDETKKVCKVICEQMYSERVKKWMRDNIKVDLFVKDICSDLNKHFSQRKKPKIPVLPPQGRPCVHNDNNTLSGFHTLNNIRELCCNVMENDTFHLDRALQETYTSIIERNDINDKIVCLIGQSLFDLVVLIIAYCPSKLSGFDGFVKIWSLTKNKFDFFSPKTLRILQTAPVRSASLQLFSRMIEGILDKQLIDSDEVESQCVGFYSKEWNEDTLEMFAQFLNCLTERVSSDKMAYLFDFLADFCVDL